MQDNTLEVQETDRSCKVIHTKIVQILVHYLCLGMLARTRDRVDHAHYCMVCVNWIRDMAACSSSFSVKTATRRSLENSSSSVTMDNS